MPDIGGRLTGPGLLQGIASDANDGPFTNRNDTITARGSSLVGRVITVDLFGTIISTLVGDEVLFGSMGDDPVYGGLGNDRLVGTARDTAGDRFVFDTALNAATNVDTV